jgi:tight adherence protein B
MLDPLVLAAFAAVFGLIVLAATAMGGFDSEHEKRFRRRLGRVGGAPKAPDRKEGDVELRRFARDSAIPGLDRLVKRFVPKPAELRRRLARTGLRISAGEYVLASLFVALAVGLTQIYVFGGSPVLAVLAAVGAGFALPHGLVNQLIARRLNIFTGQFPEAIDLIVRGLKSGLPVPASMHTVAEEMQNPVAGEFRLVTDRLRVGQTLDDALRDVADRLPTPEFRFFVISLAVQRETGGNLAETLENLADILRKRRQMKLKIKAMSSEAKASAMILGSLPFLLFAVLFAINPGYVSTLFQDPRGVLMIGAGLAFLGLGILVMAKMVRFEI